MAHNLDESIALLERTPAVLNALLRGLPATWTLSNEGGNTWDARGAVAHLANLERTDWMPRLSRILESGESRAFDPVDREAFRRDQDRSLADLLDEFSRLRTANLTTVRNLQLQPDDLARRGRHPSLGAVTLSELLATWAAHDLTHLHQITRVMAHQYRDLVGPWQRYLGVMQCKGHSANA